MLLYLAEEVVVNWLAMSYTNIIANTTGVLLKVQ